MHRHLLNKILFIVIAILIGTGKFFLFPVSTHASISPELAISPTKYNLPVKPREKQQVIIRLSNRSDVTIPLKGVTMDFAPSDLKGGLDYSHSLPNRSAIEWFAISPNSFTLDPGESKDITITITPPATLDPGGFYAVAMFQADFPGSYFDSIDQTQAKIIPWIGTLFLLQHGDGPPLDENALTIKRFIIPRFSFKSNVPALVEVANNTAYHLAPETDFLLASLRGPVKAKITTDETTILPGSSRIFEAEIMDAPMLGLYQGKAVVRVASFQKSAVTWPLMLITFKGVIALILVLILIAGLLYYRRRLLLAGEVFVGLGRKYTQKLITRRTSRKNEKK